MKIKLHKNSLLSIAFFFLTIQNCSVLIALNLSDIIRYIGIALLLFGGLGFLIGIPGRQRRDLLILFLVCILFMCIGFFKQNFNIARILYYCISYVLLAFLAIFPNTFLSSNEIYRKIGNAVLMAIFAATILSLLNGYSIITSASEGILVNFGFNGGMEHRNYYAYSILGCFILFDLDKIVFGKRKNGMHILLIILMVISNSRSVLVVFTVYYIIANYRIWKIQGVGRKTILFFIVFAMIMVGIPVYQFIISKSETFSFRINGLNNYIKYITGDWEHIIFGNAALAYADTGMTYDQNIRSVIGWDGSVELVLLNILIKSGVFGLIAFVFLFINDLRRIRPMRWRIIQARTYAIFFSFLVSALVESYVGNLNLMYSPLCYMLLASLPYTQADGSFAFKR